MPIQFKVFVAVCLYALLGNFALEAATAVMPKQSAALLVGVVWLIGFVWLVGAIAMGPRQGLMLLRAWIGAFGGLLVAATPFAFLPHPLMLVGGGLLGIDRVWFMGHHRQGTLAD